MSLAQAVWNPASILKNRQNHSRFVLARAVAVKGFRFIVPPSNLAAMIALPICDFESSATCLSSKGTRFRRAEVHDGTDVNRAWEWIYRPDAAVTEDEDRRLRKLLVSCFAYNPYFRFRRFHLERPAHHWLARSASGRFVAHAAVHEKGSSGTTVR